MANLLQVPHMNPDKVKHIWSFTEQKLIPLVLDGDQITPENFFVNTKGTFRVIEAIPEGFLMIAQSKSSQYFVNEERTELIRKSDHWGHGIKFCHWHLEGYPKKHCRKFKKLNEGKMFIGQIAFGDLKPNFDFKIPTDINNKVQEELRPKDPVKFQILPTDSKTKATWKIARKRNYELSNEILKADLPVPKPEDFKTNHIADLWNEVVENKFTNLSYDRFKEFFDKYAAVKIKVLVPKYQCKWAQSCAFQSSPDHAA